MGVARIFQRGGHTDSYRGYSSDCHLNIVSCLLTRRLTKGGVTGTPGSPLATPMSWYLPVAKSNEAKCKQCCRKKIPRGSMLFPMDHPGKQGWHSGEAFVSQQSGLGTILARWVEVVQFLLCSEGFLRFLRLPSPQKPTPLNCLIPGGYPFYIPFIEKRYPFHTPSLSSLVRVPMHWSINELIQP